MAHLLSNDGTLYSWGTDLKKTGILGLGSKLFSTNRPMPNKTLFDFRISSVSVSENHCCVSDSKGCLFSWGTGFIGETGIDDLVVFSPVLVKKASKIEVKRV